MAVLLAGTHLPTEHEPKLRERARNDVKVAQGPIVFKTRPRRKHSKHSKHAPLQRLNVCVALQPRHLSRLQCNVALGLLRVTTRVVNARPSSVSSRSSSG
jgi:hypothetical protein